MSKKGLLKAEYNRVRTSTALKANDMWEKTIGQTADPQAGTNSAIEASIYAPTRGQGNRTERQERAAQLVTASGYQPAITDYNGLMNLAKAQGIGNETRGACKLCGGLGHLTKKCTNVLTGHTIAAGTDIVALLGAGVTAGPGGTRVMGLLPEVGDMSDFDSSDLSSSDDGSDSSSDSGRKRKRKHKSKSKKEKKEKHKKKHKKGSKDKKSKRSKSS